MRINDAEFQDIYEDLKSEFLAYSDKALNSLNTESKLSEAMKYSFSAGGKRIRPILMIYTAKLLSKSGEEILPFAFALECMHTYSLIHDDLPALDNDSLRRGKPTNHVVYGEAMAILAGDALLNFAFEHALSVCNTEKKVKALAKLSEYSGYRGMLEGQALDMESEKSVFYGEERLNKIAEYKTSKFITAAFTIPAILYCEEKLDEFSEFGRLLGKLFQFADDLKDVISTSSKLGKSIGKDEAEDKLSAVKIYGLDGLKSEIAALEYKCKTIANSIDKRGFFDCFITRLRG